MKVIDFHVHLATAQHWTPGVMAFVRENNPGYFEHFAGGPVPEGVAAYFASQGVTQMVMLAEYPPKCTGVVTNEAITRFCRDHKELIPFASISLEVNTPYGSQARYALEELGMKGFQTSSLLPAFLPQRSVFFPFL